MMYESNLAQCADDTMTCDHKFDLARVKARIPALAKAERIRVNVSTNSVRTGLVFGSTYPALVISHPLSLTTHYRDLVVDINQKRDQVTVRYYLRGNDVFGKEIAKKSSRLNRGGQARAQLSGSYSSSEMLVAEGVASLLGGSPRALKRGMQQAQKQLGKEASWIESVVSACDKALWEECAAKGKRSWLR